MTTEQERRRQLQQQLIEEVSRLSDEERDRLRERAFTKRQRPPKAGGVEQGLTDRQIEAIRAAYATGRVTRADLAQRYGVNKRVISSLVQGMQQPRRRAKPRLLGA